MGVRILYDKESDYACLYCSTSMWAFGGIFYGEEEAEAFLKWYRGDPRLLRDHELESKIVDFRSFDWEAEKKMNEEIDRAEMLKEAQWEEKRMEKKNKGNQL